MDLSQLIRRQPVAKLELAQQVVVAVPKNMDMDEAFSGGYVLATVQGIARGTSTGVGYRYLVAQVSDCNDSQDPGPRKVTLTVHATDYYYNLAPLSTNMELPSHHDVQVVSASDFL